MSDLFADTGILESLLLCQQLTLESKRNMLLVSKFFQAFTSAQLCLQELYVGPEDCTIANARFVLRVLMPRVPGLLLCARDEQFAPKMNLAALASLSTVTASMTGSSMNTTAAFFLGHALATSKGFVRLGMGRLKTLSSLRERDHLELDIFETANPIDLLLMRPCLLANAERRLDDFPYLGSSQLNLSNLHLGEEEMCVLSTKMRDAFDRKRDFDLIDLSQNSFGLFGSPVAMQVVVDALCDPKIDSCVRVDYFNLSATCVDSAGIRVLVRPMRSGLLKIRQLNLCNACIDNEGITCLLRALRTWGARRFGGGRGLSVTQPGADVLEELDLSRNPFSNEGFEQLLIGAGLARLRVLHLYGLFHVSMSAVVTLANAVRTGLYPAIQEINTSYSEENLPMQKAVRHWRLRHDLAECDRDWDRWCTQFRVNNQLCQ